MFFMKFHPNPVASAFAAILALAWFVPAAAAFDPNANGNVLVTLVQPDGRIIVGGSFTTVQPSGEAAPVDRPNIARFNTDGTLDTAFNLGLNGEVVALALQADGRILVGGRFNQARVGATGPVYARSGLLRVEASGSLDLGFDPRPQGGPASAAAVSAIALETDGSILIGGTFTTLQPNGSGAAVARSRLARLRSDGSIDATFTPAANNVVFDLVLQSDGKILVGGGFTTIQSTGSDTPETVNRLARLERDGTLDAGFRPSLDNRALSLALEPGGGILVAGDFRLVHGTSDSADSTRTYLARFTAAGELDQGFSPSPNAGVAKVLLQRDGRILLGGNFTSVALSSGGAVSRAYVARLDQTGAVDQDFVVGLNAAVCALAVQSDNKIVIGGYFTRLTQSGAAASVQRNHLARVSANGDLDGTFGNESGTVLAAALESDGSLLLGGNFQTIGGATRLALARLKADGSLDPDFHPELDGSVNAIVVQTDGRLVVGGQFSQVGSVSRSNLARLNRDGTVDESFNPGPNGAVSALDLQSDGRILVGGSFTTFDLDDGQNDDDDSDGTTTDDTGRAYLAELNSSGQLTSLDLSLNSAVTAFARQGDGRLILGGSFSSIGGETIYSVARLSSGNLVDTGFKPNPGGSVQTIAVQADGKIVLGGSFTLIQYGADSTDDDVERYRIARLNSDGSIDANFNPGLNNSAAGLLATADNQVLVGGTFTKILSPETSWNYLARIRSDGAYDPTFTVQTDDRVSGLIAGPNGAIYVYGRFTKAYTTAGDALVTSGHVFRLTADSSLDHAYGISTSNPAGEAVLALAVQSNGRVLVGGQFEALAGRATPHLARLYSGGTPDTSFASTTDGAVRALLAAPQTLLSEARINLLALFDSSGVLQGSFDRSDMANLVGSISAVLVDGDALIVGGTFSVVGSTIQHLARFSRTGKLDAGFNPAPDGSVTALARQGDGKIVVGGAFTTMAGVARPYLARLNTDGSADADFAPPALNAAVAAVVIQTDGGIVAGGSFTSVEVNDGQNDDDDADGSTTDDTGRHYLARFLGTGALDTTYDPKADGAVSALLLLPDGRLVAGGSFMSLQPGSGNTYTRNYVALLSTSGGVEEGFNPGASGVVLALARQADGKILLGGNFTVLQMDDGESDDDDGDGTTTDDADRRYLARLNADFSLDLTFDPRPNSTVNALAVDSSGRIYAGGAFLNFEPIEDTVINRSRLARLNSDGAIDPAFIPAVNDAVKAVVCLSDDTVVVGGAFTNILADFPIYAGGDFSTIGDLALPRLARLNENGVPDSTFAPAPDGTVHALAADASGRVLVGGAFSQIAGSARSRLARFNANGSLDDSFAPAIDGTVRAMAMASGTILVGGEFGTVNGTSRTRLARLNDSGALDTGFSAQVNGTVHAIAALPDGRALVAGEFTQVNGSARRYLVRLQADGSLDAGFSPEPDGPVYALSVRSDGTLLAGGSFTQIAGQSRDRLAVLKSDGSLDTAFTATANGTVWIAAGLLDGATLVGGSFTSSTDVSGHLLKRVTGGTTGAYAFSVGSAMNAATWTLSGSAPIFSSVIFAYSTNGNSWTSLGNAAASGDGRTWSWSGATVLPANTAYLLRARAVVAAAQGGSSGVVEVMWQFLNTQAAGAITLTSGAGGSSGSGGSGSSSSGGSSGVTSSLPAGTTVTALYTGSTNFSASGFFSDFSTLLRLKGSELHFVNFVLAGNSSRRVFLRVAGPGLRGIDVSDYAPAPRLELYTSAGALWSQAKGPVTDASLTTLATQLGALPLETSGADAAVLTTINPGAYTLAVWDGAGTGGAVLVELFEVDGIQPAALVAYASRASDAANSGAQTTEFTIRGGASQSVLVRALGPALTPQGITGALADPQLLLQNANGDTVASNDNWETPVATGSATAASATSLVTATSTVGAVALTTGSRDAAVLVTLAPGVYTAAVVGPASATGISELEIYEMPPEDDEEEEEEESNTSSSDGGGGAPSDVATALLAALLLFRRWRERTK